MGDTTGTDLEGLTYPSHLQPIAQVLEVSMLETFLIYHHLYWKIQRFKMGNWRVMILENLFTASDVHPRIFVSLEPLYRHKPWGGW